MIDVNHESIVLIDDLRTFKNDIRSKVLRTLDEALQWLDLLDKNSHIKQLWLDHDLGLKGRIPQTIIPFINKLEENSYKKLYNIDLILIHTSNPIGAKQMESALSKFYKVQKIYAGYYFKA